MAVDEHDTGTAARGIDDAAGDAADNAASDAADNGRDIVAQDELNSDEVLERAILYALEQGTEKLEQSGGFEPFTVLIEGEELFIEEHPGESEDESYASARRTVYQMERLCNAYVFCYDGFVDLEDGTSDAVVAEFANKGDAVAQVIVRMYHQHGDHFHFDNELYQVGEAELLFSDETINAGADDKPTADDENKPA
jgi:hypothetical protein